MKTPNLPKTSIKHKKTNKNKCLKIGAIYPKIPEIILHLFQNNPCIIITHVL